MTGKINLVLVPDDSHHDPRDFSDIAERIRSRCSDVVPHVCLPRQLKLKKWLYAFRPTLYVASLPLRRFKPVRGRVLAGIKMAKSEQYRRLEEEGIATPRWQVIRSDTRLSREEWGNYVVLKPDSGRRGQDVKIKKTGRVNGEKYKDSKDVLLAQQFVYTGSEPVAYRVLTLFGKALYLEYCRNTRCGKPLAGPDSFHSIGGYNIVASAHGGKHELVEDEPIRRFAEDVATRCFPEVPLLGLDVMREVNTGQLYIAEANPYGQTWHFSSQLGKSMQRDYALNYTAQFGAFDIAAKRLIEIARERAV
jgi:hypothetical protein